MVVKDAAMFLSTYYEVSAIVWYVLMLIHCYYYYGKWTVYKIFLVGMLYGLILENSGAVEIPGITEGYFYEKNYSLYLFEFFGVGFRLSQVPLATHLGWSNVFYIGWYFWKKISEAFPKIKKNIFLGGFIMSISGVIIDLQIDVVATHFHWWVWNEMYSPLWFGVPLINFVAWFAAVFVFGMFWVWIHEHHPDWDEKKQTLRLLYYIPVILALDALVGLVILNPLDWAGFVRVP